MAIEQMVQGELVSGAAWQADFAVALAAITTPDPEPARTDAKRDPSTEPAERDLTVPEQKWGVDALKNGFQVLPDTLVRSYHRLGLTSTDFVVLLNLSMAWWFPDRQPYPRVTTIARRMGVHVRTVQRSLTAMKAKRLLTWDTIDIGGVRRRKYDLTPLAEQVKLWAAAERKPQQQPRRAHSRWRAG
jgi:hypothetical protein